MKKLILFFSFGLLSLSTPRVFAQTNAYEIGDKTIGAGISLGYFGYTGTRHVSFPPISFFGEYGFHEYISAGAYFGFGSWKYNYSTGFYDYHDRWTQVGAGIRGSLHYVSLLNEHLELDIDPTKFDFYFTLLTGLEFENYHYEENYSNTSGSDTDVSLTIGSILGFEYMVTEQIGVFTELGWNAFGYLTLGATARF